MFGWFSKRSRSATTTTSTTTTKAPSTDLPAPVMREIPPPPPPASPPPPARPDVPPGSGPPTHDVLVAQLKNVDADVRVAAARELGRRGEPAAVPALVATLCDAESAVRVAAAHALGKLRDERSINALAEAMASDEDANVQAAARVALQAIGTPGADAALAADDARREQAAREAHARANPTVDRSRGVEGLIEAFRGADERLHAQAADALAEAGPAAVEPLVDLLRAENVWLRKRAADLLGRIGDARAAEPLRAALDAVSPDDRSYESYQFRDAVQRALAAVAVAPPAAQPPLAASRINTASSADTTTSAPSADTTTSTQDPSATQSGEFTDDDSWSATPQAAEPATSNPELANLPEEQLGERLLEIARAALGGGRPPLDSYDARRAAARSIGAELHRRGGIDAMRLALDTYVGNLPGRHPIEQAWDGVGEWRG